MYSLNDYNYQLPAELIAQRPVKQRDRSKLLCLNRQTGALSHHRFNEIGAYLQPGDVLVLNNTAVIPARLEGRKETGGRIEVLIADYRDGIRALKTGGDFICQCMIKASKRPAAGMRLYFQEDLSAEVLGSGNGTHQLRFSTGDDFEKVLERIGKVPLPPYIKSDLEDSERYQTTYSKVNGSVAAPTAGLHFTKELLNSLKKKGVQFAFVTLHIIPSVFTYNT